LTPYASFLKVFAQLLTSYVYLVCGWFRLKETFGSLTKRRHRLINYSTKLNCNHSDGWKRIALTLFTLIIFCGWISYLVWNLSVLGVLALRSIFCFVTLLFRCKLIIFKLIFWHFFCWFFEAFSNIFYFNFLKKMFCIHLFSTYILNFDLINLKRNDFLYICFVKYYYAYKKNSFYFF